MRRITVLVTISFLALLTLALAAPGVGAQPSDTPARSAPAAQSPAEASSQAESPDAGKAVPEPADVKPATAAAVEDKAAGAGASAGTAMPQQAVPATPGGSPSIGAAAPTGAVAPQTPVGAATEQAPAASSQTGAPAAGQEHPAVKDATSAQSAEPAKEQAAPQAPVKDEAAKDAAPQPASKVETPAPEVRPQPAPEEVKPKEPAQGKEPKDAKAPAAKAPAKGDAAQAPAPPAPEPIDAKEINTTLTTLLSTTDDLREEIRAKEKEVRAAATDERKQELGAELEKLRAELAVKQESFEGIAAGVNMGDLRPETSQAFDWSQELKELLGPIIAELKKMTQRPRDIERLRGEVRRAGDALPLIDRALARIKSLEAEADSKKLSQRLTEMRKAWEEKRTQQANELSVAEFKLQQLLQEESSVVASVQRIFQTFFKSRGKNLLMAVLATLGVFLLTRLLLHAALHTRLGRRWSRESMAFRAVNVAYYAFSFVAALLAGLGVLYVSGDWVLLGLSILIIFGILWSAKHSLPKVWEQTKLILNLGAVREGERIVLGDLPWKIMRLHYYTSLVNPELSGGRLRVRLDELVDKSSRPYSENEPWFPTRRGDWVLLDDTTYGRVHLQTPEAVVLSIGDSRKSYTTSAFLGQNPRNFSAGFVLVVTFGLDYAHQADVTGPIPALLEEAVKEGLAAAGFAENLISLVVEFKEAAASSLDLLVIASFDGEAASNYFKLQREIQRAAVNACNRHGWIIPFNQITVHTSQD